MRRLALSRQPVPPPLGQPLSFVDLEARSFSRRLSGCRKRRGTRRGGGAELRRRVLLARVRKLPELGEHRVDVLKRLVDVFAVLAAGEHDLSGDENQQYDLRQLHAVDQTREQLGLVLGEVPVGPRETLKADGKFDVARANHVLNLKLLGMEARGNGGSVPHLGDVFKTSVDRSRRATRDTHLELRREPEFADDLRVLARRLPRERLRLGSRAHHLARAEDERGGLRGTNTHDRRCETLRGENGGGPRQYQATKWNTEKVCTPASPQEVRVSSHLRVVLHITGVERDGL